MPIAPSPLTAMVAKLEQWKSLHDADRAAILALPHTVERLAAESFIVREGERPQYSCLLVNGLAYRTKTIGTGARSILSLHLRGDLVDLQNTLLRYADHSVQTMTKAEVAYIPREAMVDLAMRHPRVGMAMWYDTLVDGAIFREWIANNSRRDAAAALAHLLCEFGMRLEAAGLGQRASYQLPMTQEQLADALGLTPVHVNRTLMKLEDEGFIMRTQRAIAVSDWPRLAAMGDFDPHYLHLPTAGSARAVSHRA